MISILKIASKGSSAGRRGFAEDSNLSSPSSFGMRKAKSTKLRADQMRRMYERNVWVKSVVDLIAIKVSNVPPIIRGFKKRDQNTKLSNKQRRQKERIEELFVNPNSADQSWNDLVRRSVKDNRIFGHCGFELVPDAIDGTVAEIYNVLAHEIKPNIDKKGLFKSEHDAYRQIRDENVIARWPRDEFMWITPGSVTYSTMPLSPLETLRQTVTAELYASQHNLDFFANSATPRLAVMFDQVGFGQGRNAIERAKEWWNRELRGQPHKPIMMATEEGSVRLETLNIPNRDMEFQAYSAWLLMKIMAVYKMQPVVLGVILDGNQSKQNSSQQIQLFKEDALRPQLDLFRDAFNNKVIWKGFGYNTLFLEYEGFDIWDAQEKAIWHERYLRNGVFTINQVLDELGMEPVPWGDTPMIASNLQELGGEENRDDNPGTDNDNPDVPNVGDTGPAREADSRGDARRSAAALQGLREIGIDDNQIKSAASRIRKRYDSFYDRVVSFPSKTA